MSQTGRKALVLSLIIALGSNFTSNVAFAKSIHATNIRHTGFHLSQIRARNAALRHAALRRRHVGGSVLQCVAFAKQDAGIVIAGNARDWWYNAEGTYQRGHAPEAGSVLSFAATGRMPLGHVAVVSNVVDARTITIDQSHWGSRGITRDIEVKDVSENNDWTAVRVQLGHGGDYGSIYPTHGFIYARADDGRIVEATNHAPMPRLSRAPADLRVRRAAPAMEVAEVPDVHRGLDLTLPGIASDAPDRGLQ
jgi:surface antigen